MRKSPAATFKAPAVVLGGGVNGMGIVRSLARRRVPVWVVDDNPGAPEMRTRYGRKLAAPAMEGPPLIERLVELGRYHFRGQRPVLFLTQEGSVRTVSEARDAIIPLYRLTLPDRRTLIDLMHKDGFYQHARASGAPVPLTLRLRKPKDLDQISQMRFPAILKPGCHLRAYSVRFDKAYRIADAAEAISLCKEMLPVMPDLVLQEWIEGEDSDIFFCLQYVGADGAPVSSFTGRKIRSWPPRIGGTASCVPAPEAHAELDRLTSGFFRDTGFIGMGSMEYKRESGTDRYLMIEPTVGRTDYQEEVATLNGVNIPFAAYCHELGLPTPQGRVTDSVLWRHTMIDRRSARMQDQNWGRGDLERGCAADAYWRVYDPAPWLFLHGQTLVARLKRGADRFVSARAKQELS